MTMPSPLLALPHRNPGPAPGFRVSGFSIPAWLSLRRQVCPDSLTLRDNRASLVAGHDADLRAVPISSAVMLDESRIDSRRDSPSSNPRGVSPTRVPRGESIRLTLQTAPSGWQRLARVSRSDSRRFDSFRGESIRLTVFGPLPSPLASGCAGPTRTLLFARRSHSANLSRTDSHATVDRPLALPCVSRSDSPGSRSLRLPRPLAPLSESDRLAAPRAAFASFAPRHRAWRGWQASSSAPVHPPLVVSRSDSRKAIGGCHRKSTSIDLPLRLSRSDSPLPAPVRPKEVLP